MLHHKPNISPPGLSCAVRCTAAQACGFTDQDRAGTAGQATLLRVLPCTGARYAALHFLPWLLTFHPPTGERPGEVRLGLLRQFNGQFPLGLFQVAADGSYVEAFTHAKSAGL